MLSTKPKKKLARRQHIVSSWYLDNFCDGGSKLCVYERGKEIRASVPRNECVERDFHEFDLAGRQTSNDYEDWLSRIEGEAKAIIPDCRWQTNPSIHTMQPSGRTSWLRSSTAPAKYARRFHR